jgi:hypothetical protein
MALRKQHFHDDDEDREQITHTDKRSRLTFDIKPELRRRIRILAAQNDLSIGEYLEPFLEQYLPQVDTRQQRRPATPKMLEELRQVREQIMQEREGKLFEDSVEMIRQMREERSRELEQL